MVEKKNDYGITSLVLGIVSVVFSWTVILGIPAGIIGLVFASKQKKIYENGIMTAGLVTSIIGLSISVIALIMFFIMWIPMMAYMH